MRLIHLVAIEMLAVWLIVVVMMVYVSVAANECLMALLAVRFVHFGAVIRTVYWSHRVVVAIVTAT